MPGNVTFGILLLEFNFRSPRPLSAPQRIEKHHTLFFLVKVSFVRFGKAEGNLIAIIYVLFNLKL